METFHLSRKDIRILESCHENSYQFELNQRLMKSFHDYCVIIKISENNLLDYNKYNEIYLTYSFTIFCEWLANKINYKYYSNFLEPDIGVYDPLILFLEYGVDPNVTYSKTPLMIYCGPYAKPYRVNKNCIEILLKHGADPNIQNEYGQTCIFCINFNFRSIDMDVWELFLKYGLDFTLVEENGGTILTEIVSEYQHSFDCEYKDNCVFGDLIKFLIERCGVNPNIKDVDGETALKYFQEDVSCCQKCTEYLKGLE